MPSAAQKLLWRYRVLTALLPAYAAALLFYGGGLGLAGVFSAHGFGAQSWDGALRWFALLGLAGLAVCDIEGWLAWAGYRFSGVLGRVRQGDLALRARLAALMQPDLPQLEPVLCELDPLPYLASAGGDRLYLTASILELDDAALSALITHEQAHALLHAETPLLGAWSWLVAPALCWLLADWPLAVPLLAALHVSLLLRARAAASARREEQADRMAAATVGRERYLAALLPHLVLFEQPGSTALRKMRLRGMGLSAAEIEQWLA